MGNETSSPAKGIAMDDGMCVDGATNADNERSTQETRPSEHVATKLESTPSTEDPDALFKRMSVIKVAMDANVEITSARQAEKEIPADMCKPFMSSFSEVDSHFTPTAPPLPMQAETMVLVEQKILSLIDESNEKKIRMGALAELFHSKCSFSIPYMLLGHEKLRDLIGALALVSMKKDPMGFEYVCRADEDINAIGKSKWGTPYGGDKSPDGEPRRPLLKPMSDFQNPFTIHDHIVNDAVIDGRTVSKQLAQDTPVQDCSIAIAEAGDESTYIQLTTITPAPQAGGDAIRLLEQQILSLIDKSEEKKILLGALPLLFKSTYCVAIPHKPLGHKKLKNLVESLPLVALCGQPAGFEYVRRADEELSYAKEHMGEKNKLIHVQGSVDLLLFQQQVLALIDKSSNARISLSQLPLYYSSEYSADIPYERFGQCKLKDLLASLPEVSVHVTDDGKNSHFVCRAHGIAINAEGSLRSDALHSDNSKLVPCSTILDASHADGATSISGLQTTDDPIIRVAKDMASSKMQRRVLAVLSENPGGVTCSFLMKHTKGLLHFIQSHAQAAGKDFFSPVAVLRHCDGVRHKFVDGHNIFLIDDKYLEAALPTEESLRAECNRVTTDIAAAKSFLRLIEDAFRGQPWPTSKNKLKQFLMGLDASSSSNLNAWIKKAFPKELSDGKRISEAINRIILQLHRMGFLTDDSQGLVWHLNLVSDIAVHSQRPTTVDDSSDRSASGNAIGKHEASTMLVETVEQLNRVKTLFPFYSQNTEVSAEECRVVAIDCEGVPEHLFLVQVGTLTTSYVFDCVKLGVSEVCGVLAPLLMDPRVTKLFHDLHHDAVALSQIGGVEPLRGTLDTQLAVEALSGDLHVGFNQMLQQFGQPRHPLKQSMKHKMDNGRLFAQRPLPPDVMEYASLDVALLMKARDSILGALGSMTNSIQKASDTRARLAPSTGGARQICFNVANSYAMRSLELLQELRPDDMLVPLPLEVSDDASILLDLLPKDLRESLVGRTSSLSDIVIDKGRAPLAWINGQRCFLGEENRTVEPEDIGAVVEQLGGFGSDNRAGLEKQLHRVSAIRNRQLDVIGLTMRVGRHVNGNATMISDLLFSDCSKSILFLGEPGSGKTTVVREVTRLLSERFNVCIVDTSNEIAGDGDIPHPCVGFARRMMVPSLDKQSSVMTECVQNHTPEIMVIDEIGRPTEVEAARTCKQRGVRLIASAHGSMRKLIKNPKLRGLIGGVETVTLGDAQAKLESKKAGKTATGIQKLKAQRAGSPTFDIIVELMRGAHHEWRVVMDAGDAVDRVLEGQEYLVQRRTRDPLTGGLTLQLETS